MKVLKFISKNSTQIILVLFACVVIGVYLVTQSQKLKMDQLTLISTDEFDQSSLSEAWQLMNDGTFLYTGFYSDDQASIIDGQLKIKLSRETGIKGDQVYSTTIRTAMTYTSGYFEVKAILPKINEYNAIIALTNDDALENTDPSKGAKVVFASSNNQPYPLLATGIYYDNLGEPTETNNAFVLSLIYNEPHRYGLLWTPTSYAFYFDGYKLWESTKTDVSNEPMYLTLGFDFPFYTTQEFAELNETLIVEYVKIYSINP